MKRPDRRIGSKIKIVCPECDGEGKAIGNDETNIIKTCEMCGGTGKIEGIVSTQ